MSWLRRVVVIGTGLMGTSVGLALRRNGIEVLLADRDEHNLRVAVSLGAGIPHRAEKSGREDVDLVIIGVPPAALGSAIGDALRHYDHAYVTDLGSVKTPATTEVLEAEPALASRYVGGHPMAGSERSGPLAAMADLFDGRAWAITPHPGSSAGAIDAVELLAKTCGAFPVRSTPEAHDEAVALVSHLPHVTAAVVAALLDEAAEDHLVLAGQGIRDVTRIAAGDPAMWSQILGANARPVARLLRAAAEQMADLADGLDADPTREASGPETPMPERLNVEEGAGGRGADLTRRLLERGTRGVRRLPGKHGERQTAFASVAVLLADRPGELARLLADVGAAGVNVEDVRIDHSPGTPAGLVELFIAADAEQELQRGLESRGWSLHR